MKNVRLTFTGDILIEPEQYKAVCSQSQNFDLVLENSLSCFSETNFLIGNLETPLAGKDLLYTNHKWSFNTPESLAESLKKGGFNLLTTANNHCLDRGKEGLKNTIKFLDDNRIEHIGTYTDKSVKDKVFIKEIEGIRFAFLSYTYGTNAAFNHEYLGQDQFMVDLFQAQEKRYPSKQEYYTRLKNKLYTIFTNYTGYRFHALPYIKRLKKDIQKCKSAKADYIVMCMHSGGQYNVSPDPYTLFLTKFLFTQGVNIIVGNHPHVVHHAERRDKEHFVAYSLGNLCSYPGSQTAYHENDDEVLAAYSVVVHVDFCTEMSRFDISFEICKSVVGEDKVSRTYSLYDLYSSESDPDVKNLLQKDNERIVRKFLNKPDISVPLQKEYKF